MPDEEDAAGRGPRGWDRLDLASLAGESQASVGPLDADLGRVIKGKYKILELLGAGGMAVVYRAEEQGLIRRDVAIKLLKPESVSQGMLSRFMKEAQAMAAITHANVVHLFEIDRTPEGQIYLVMERLIGKTLHQVLRGMQDASETFSWDRLAALMLQACRALQAIHKQKIVHRDIKPSNLFCCGIEDDDWHLKVLDFGIAKAPSSKEASPDSMATPLTRDGMFVGTPHYAAPELIRQLPTIDQRADIFALGVIMYQCVTGTLPFQGEHQDIWTVIYRTLNERPPSPRERAPERSIPPQVDSLIMKAMEIEPDKRFSSAAELAEAIRATVRITLDGTSVRKPQLADSSAEMTPRPTEEPNAGGPRAEPAASASALNTALLPPSTPAPAADQATPMPPSASLVPVISPTAIQEMPIRTSPAVLIAVSVMSLGILILLALFVYEATRVQTPTTPAQRPKPPVSLAQPPQPQQPAAQTPVQGQTAPQPQARSPSQPQAEQQPSEPANPPGEPELDVHEEPAAEVLDDARTTPPAAARTSPVQDTRRREIRAVLDKMVESHAADKCLPLHLIVGDGIYDELPVKVQVDSQGKAKASATVRSIKQRLPKSADDCILKIIEAQPFPAGEGAVVVSHTLRFD